MGLENEGEKGINPDRKKDVRRLYQDLTSLQAFMLRTVYRFEKGKLIKLEYDLRESVGPLLLTRLSAY